MSSQSDGILASLHKAMLNEDLWHATSAIIDEACGMKGTHLVIVDGELAREYVEVFIPAGRTHAAQAAARCRKPNR